MLGPSSTAPGVRYLSKRHLIAATAIAFAARTEGVRFGTFARAVCGRARAGRDQRRLGLGPGARGVLRRAGRGLWEIALIRRNLLVAVVAVDRGPSGSGGGSGGRLSDQVSKGGIGTPAPSLSSLNAVSSVRWTLSTVAGDMN